MTSKLYVTLRDKLFKIIVERNHFRIIKSNSMIKEKNKDQIVLFRISLSEGKKIIVINHSLTQQTKYKNSFQQVYNEFKGMEYALK